MRFCGKYDDRRLQNKERINVLFVMIYLDMNEIRGKKYSAGHAHEKSRVGGGGDFVKSALCGLYMYYLFDKIIKVP